MREYDIVIIGGGSAGLAAAIGAKEEGIHNIIILERENCLGGILNQCIHSGFESWLFRGELTGPEFTQKLVDKISELKIPYYLNTAVLDVTDEKLVTAVNSENGIIKIKAKSIIMATGCREWPRGAANIPRSRHAGILTAGTAQRFVNIEGYLPGKEVVILGSGDIGLIMARRLTIEGAKVKGLVEIMPYPGGTAKNVSECLKDFNIPLLLSHTVVDVRGKDRLEGVIVAEVDENKKPIRDSEQFIPCDTLLLSVGLRPEIDLLRKVGAKICIASSGPEIDESYQTSVSGIFTCGSVLHAYDWVGGVVSESITAGKNAAAHVIGYNFEGKKIEVTAGKGIKYVVPRYINPANIEGAVNVKFRVEDILNEVKVSVYANGNILKSINRDMMRPGDVEAINIEKAIFEQLGDSREIVLKIDTE